MRKNINRRSHLVVCSMILLFLAGFATPVFATIPEAQSGGKFFQAKGTKADETYQEQGRAGGPAYEWGKGLQVWQILLKPFVEYVREWDSNVFLTPSGRKTDWINGLNAGTTAELPLNGGQHRLSGVFKDESEWFSRFDSQNHNDYTVGGALDLSFVPFSLSVEDNFRRTVDRSDTEFTNRVSREENTAHALLEIPFAAFFIETEALDFNTAYRDPVNRQFDHNDFTVYQRVGYDVAPSTQLLGEYGYIHLGYPNDHTRDGNADQAMLGLRGNWTERVTYQAWGGVQWRIYDQDTRPDFNGAVFRGALQYDITDKSNVILKFNRDPQESTYDNQSFYVRNKGTVGWKQQVAERWFVTADGALSYNEYSRITVLNGDEKTRRDYVAESGVKLEYLMANDVVSLYGEYRFRSRDANLDGLEYQGHILSAGVKAQF